MDFHTALVRIARQVAKQGRRMMYGGSRAFATHAEITKARLDHLASLKLDLSNKRVLEVGAGMGTLTKFFEDRGCTILSTDGNPKNVEEMRRKYPHRKVDVLDLDKSSNLASLGHFNIVFCYGTLYHLSRPEPALKALCEICEEIILVETSVALGHYSDLYFVQDTVGRDQAVGGVGCRPARSWLMETLRKYCGYAYITKTQPRHRAFPIDWRTPPNQPDYRAVFVGSKRRLTSPELVESLIDIQQYT